MIIIKIGILYFIQITHTDDSPQRVPGWYAIKRATFKMAAKVTTSYLMMGPELEMIVVVY